MRIRETEKEKQHFILDEIIGSELLMKSFTDFSRLEFVEFELFFQNILYFTGKSNKEINEEGTNKLNWKIARFYWNEDILTKLREYDPFGPKGKVSKFAMISRILPIFEGFHITQLFLKSQY